MASGSLPPYGDGITFWALGEIVKAHAGIYESDTSEVAREKLDATLPTNEERPLVTRDVVNTAARIQSQAPINGVAVGMSTYQAAQQVFAFERLEAITARGKSQPVASEQLVLRPRGR